jgi:hypothetical protein
MSATYLGKVDEKEYNAYLSKKQELKQEPKKDNEITYLRKEREEELQSELVQGRDIARAGKVVASRVVGLPQNLKDLVDTVLIWGLEKTTGKDLTKMKETAESSRILPRPEEVSKYIEKKFPSTVPRTAGEEKAEEVIGTFADLALPLPGEKLKFGANLIRPILGTAAGEAAEYGAETLNLSDKQKGWAKAIAQAIPMVVSGKLKPTDKELGELYEAGKALGLTDKELTPLLQSEEKMYMLGSAAKKTPETARRMESIRKKLGPIVGGMTEEAASLPAFTKEQSNKFIEALNKLKRELEHTLNPSEEKKKAISFIENTISNMSSGKSPIDGLSLVNFYHDINAATDWSKTGTKHLVEAKKIVKETLKDIDPSFANRFDKANELYSKMKSFEEKVGWTPALEKSTFVGEWGALLAGLAFGHVKPVFASIVGERIARKIATEMLTNPNWQNILRTTERAVKDQSPKLVNAAYNQLKSKVKKEFPEEYKEIKWPT